MFIAHLNRGQYYDKRLSKFSRFKRGEFDKYSQFGYPLGGTVVHHNGFDYNAAIAVELLSHEPQQDRNYIHQVWIKRENTWFNVDNNEQRVFPMSIEPQNPTLVVYEREGEALENDCVNYVFCWNCDSLIPCK